jgi:hypothetical protein
MDANHHRATCIEAVQFVNYNIVQENLQPNYMPSNLLITTLRTLFDHLLNFNSDLFFFIDRYQLFLDGNEFPVFGEILEITAEKKTLVVHSHGASS